VSLVFLMTMGGLVGLCASERGASQDRVKRFGRRVTSGCVRRGRGWGGGGQTAVGGWLSGKGVVWHIGRIAESYIMRRREMARSLPHQKIESFIP